MEKRLKDCSLFYFFDKRRVPWVSLYCNCQYESKDLKQPIIYIPLEKYDSNKHPRQFGINNSNALRDIEECWRIPKKIGCPHCFRWLELSEIRSIYALGGEEPLTLWFQKQGVQQFIPPDNLIKYRIDPHPYSRLNVISVA